MKYGLFSDIHSNWEAFVAVQKALDQEKVDQYVFLGDIVGYGADPHACIGLLKKLIDQRGCRGVAGNHDHAVCGLTPYANYARSAQDAIEWTKKQLDKAEMDFLAGLKLVDTVDDFLIVHASLESPRQWGYVLDIDDADINFKQLKTPLCFIGHTHSPRVFTSGEIIDWFVAEEIRIQKGCKYIINVGSVGQPRDGNPKAGYAIYDSAQEIVQIKRIEYDVTGAQKKILGAGLPKILAERLAFGK